MLLKSLMAVAAMLICLSASAIDKVVKSTGLDNEVTSLEELYTSRVLLENSEGNVLCIPSGWDCKVSTVIDAISSNDKGIFYELLPDGDHYLMPIYNVNGDRRRFWAGEAFVNAQPGGGNVIFGLGGDNDQKGQDGPNLALWDVTYEAGKGFAFHNVGRDIYLSSDATDARPSEEIVYWKAYTAYHAGYVQEEVFTAYNEATAAARTTETIEALQQAKNDYDQNQDLNAFGDAINAAIDVINACESVNAAYANLDEAGNTIATEVLAKYENKEYANIAELRAAYIPAAKAQTTPGSTMTGAIINPSFEFGTLEGWTSTDGGDVAKNYNFAQRTGDKFVERWTAAPNTLSDGSLLQTLTGMPNGKYTLTAEMQNKEQGNGDAPGTGFYLVANDDKTAVKAHGETVTVSTVVTDNTLTIGTKLIECSGNWVCEDNFQLTYNGPVEPTTYAITIAEDIENGTITTDVAEAEEGTTVTITAIPAEGYKLESISVMNGETPVEVTTENTFVMPAAAVAISAIFAAEAVEPEPETPTFTATLVHTASSTRGSDATITNTVDAEKEHVNQTNFNNVWAASAYAEFSLADLPNGATITKATLSYTGIGSGKNRDTDVLYVNAGETIDYEGMPASSEGVALDATKIETVTFPANATTPFTCDVTEALKATLASQNYIIIKWTNNVGGGDIAGKASENAPQLVVEYLPGAPEIANASFEADGEKTAGNSPLTLTGWTFDGVGSEYNDTQLLPANSESKSQFGSSDPSDGEYSLFFRYGWNGGGNVVTITSDALTEIPAGDYTLSVDYKQHYAYDEDNQQNENTKVGIALVNGEETISSEESPAAAATKGATKNTYFNETEWSTLTASFTADKAIAAGAKVVITLYAAGARRSDFFLDNVQLIKVPGIELALIDLNKAIENAKAEEAKYTVGDGLFQYPAAQIEPLTTAIAAAENAYAAAESKEAVVAATTALNNALASFAPVATLPAADKQYTLSLQTTDEASPFELNIATDKISIETAGTPVTFVAQENGTYALSNGTEYVVYKGGNDTWSLTASAEVYGWAIAAIEGGYTITGKNGFLGTNTKDGATAGSTCYGDKKTSNGFYIWTISDYAVPVEPTTYAITIAESIENGAIVTEPANEAEEGATITITATPAEGYKLESISVKNGEEDVEVSAENTFVMPAAPVTVSATFVEDTVEPTPELPEIAHEFTSIEELAGKSFAIINKETGKMLYGTDAQNLGYDNGDAAIKETNTGYYFKLDTPAEDAEDATIANCHLLRLITPAGAEYNIWGNPGYLNTQPTTGNCSFILGLNNQNGQDIKNGAVWDIQYVEGKGFTLLNKGTGLYLNDNLPAKYDEPVYWTFCTFPEEPSAEIANMTLSVKEGATVDPEDGTFPVTFGYTATVTPEDLALPEGILTYTVTPEGGEAQEFETDIQLDVNERNIYIKDFDKDVERYTITIKSVRFHYIDIETFEYVDIATIPVENLSIVIENPVSVNGINAAAKSNRKVVENGRVVIYKNGVKTMSSGVSIR